MGRARRRTQPLLAASIVREDDPPFEPDWGIIEGCCGHKLPEAARTRITVIVERYLDEERNERAAPNLGETIKWARDVQSAALHLERILPGVPLPDGDNETPELRRLRDGQKFILASLEVASERQHNPIFRELFCNNMMIVFYLHWLGKQMGGAAAKMEKNATAIGFVEGEAWDRMICDLTAVAEDYQIPVGVSNTSNAKNPPFGFRELVDELQFCMPEQARRHLGQNNTTSADAIRDARNRRPAGHKN